jgi:hypothetical protein
MVQIFKVPRSNVLRSSADQRFMINRVNAIPYPNHGRRFSDQRIKPQPPNSDHPGGGAPVNSDSATDTPPPATNSAQPGELITTALGVMQ